LQFIGIRPELHRQGHGKALIMAVEQSLRQQKARILIVDTAQSLENNHAFYLGCGFELEATIRDFYADGEDKVIFRKDL
jgi:ribosomal protein S18 acetylase RimI-like enzyme